MNWWLGHVGNGVCTVRVYGAFVTAHDVSAPGNDGPVLVDDVDDGIVTVTMNRPDRLNAMDRTLIEGLHEAFRMLDARDDVRAAILTGSGRGFCAGLDLKEPMLATGGSTPADSSSTLGRAQQGMHLQQKIARLIPLMRRMRFPIVAAVNGAATGGGLALVLGSDVRIASASARFNVAFVRIGLSGCDIGVSWLLPRIVGAARAHELMLTGRLIDATEAERIGMVVRTVPDVQLMDAALESARLIRANSPFGIWMTKEAMWSALEIGSQQAAIDLENRQQILTSFTEDMSEAAAAFMQRRPPEFRNR